MSAEHNKECRAVDGMGTRVHIDNLDVGEVREIDLKILPGGAQLIVVCIFIADDTGQAEIFRRIQSSPTSVDIFMPQNGYRWIMKLKSARYKLSYSDIATLTFDSDGPVLQVKEP
jgi:hypothetical protein